MAFLVTRHRYKQKQKNDIQVYHLVICATGQLLAPKCSGGMYAYDMTF